MTTSQKNCFHFTLKPITSSLPLVLGGFGLTFLLIGYFLVQGKKQKAT